MFAPVKKGVPTCWLFVLLDWSFLVDIIVSVWVVGALVHLYLADTAEFAAQDTEVLGDVVIQPAVKQHVAHSRGHRNQVEAEEGEIIITAKERICRKNLVKISKMCYSHFM